MYILEKWQVIMDKNPAMEVVVRLRGDVVGNPAFRSGTTIHTSTIVGYHEEGGTLVVITVKGSEYLLGKPADTKPFALRRLTRHLQDIKALLPSNPDIDLSATDALTTSISTLTKSRMQSRTAEKS
jgi:hypothetical protein